MLSYINKWQLNIHDHLKNNESRVGLKNRNPKIEPKTKNKKPKEN